MAVPEFQTIMLPLLKLLVDGQEHSLQEMIDSLTKQFELTDEEQQELLPSGRQRTFNNRVGWARTYMKKAGMIESTRRAYFRITERGKSILVNPPDKINIAYLNRYPEFVEFHRTKPKVTSDIIPLPGESDSTPEEVLENAYQALRSKLANELINTIKELTPAYFEQLVVDLIIRMGYGGSRKEAGQAIGNSGDGGIDGIINEDKLGLDVIYIQAKKWENTVGRPEIQKFAGALQGKRARKGIFITTADYSKEARDYVSNIDSKIILIDGAQLAELMIDHGIGVTRIASYDISRIDSDYFIEE